MASNAITTINGEFTIYQERIASDRVSALNIHYIPQSFHLPIVWYGADVGMFEIRLYHNVKPIVLR